MAEISPEVEVDLDNNRGQPYQSFMQLIDEAEAYLAKTTRTDIPYYIFIDELEAYYGNRQIFEGLKSWVDIEDVVLGGTGESFSIKFKTTES